MESGARRPWGCQQTKYRLSHQGTVTRRQPSPWLNRTYVWEVDGGGNEIFSGTMGANLASLCFLLCVELHGPALPLPGTDPHTLCLRQGSTTAATAGRGWRGSSRTDVDVGGSDWPRTGSASSRCFKKLYSIYYVRVRVFVWQTWGESGDRASARTRECTLDKGIDWQVCARVQVINPTRKLRYWNEAIWANPHAY